MVFTFEVNRLISFIASNYGTVVKQITAMKINTLTIPSRGTFPTEGKEKVEL